MNCFNIADKILFKTNMQNFQRHSTNLHKSFKILNINSVKIKSLNMHLCINGSIQKIYIFSVWAVLIRKSVKGVYFDYFES